MKLTSTAFDHGTRIPAKYTCDGENISPPLTFSDVPQNAKSLALVLDDPDVPKQVRKEGFWDHWVVFNIPPDVRDIREGHEPPGTHGSGTGGNLTYFGPCPPDREHRYFFRLYALDAEIQLPEKSTKTEVLKAMEGHLVAKAELIGRYERK